jgi:hypothetical protein
MHRGKTAQALKGIHASFFHPRCFHLNYLKKTAEIGSRILINGDMETEQTTKEDTRRMGNRICGRREDRETEQAKGYETEQAAEEKTWRQNRLKEMKQNRRQKIITWGQNRQQNRKQNRWQKIITWGQNRQQDMKQNMRQKRRHGDRKGSRI